MSLHVRDRIDVKPLHGPITFTFDTCFGSNGMLRPGLRDRAYHSAQAILWIRALAAYEGCIYNFPFPPRGWQCPLSDHELQHLLHALQHTRINICFSKLLEFDGYFTRPHIEWTSNLLLHLSRTTHRTHLSSTKYLLGVNTSTPLDAVFNLLLMCSNLLGSPVGEEVLKTQNKQYVISSPCSPNHLHQCSLADPSPWP